MSPVSTIALEQNLKARTASKAAAKKTTATKNPAGTPFLGRDAGLKTETDPLKNLAAKMAQDSAAKTVAIKAGKLTKKEKPASKPKSTGNAVERLTNEWPSAKGKDVKVKDRVKAADGTVIDVIGRWTKKAAKGNVPMVTGHVVSFGGKATEDTSGGKRKTVGDRLNAVAAEMTHTK
ncbi:MAG TPA: hypothetical protein VGL68_03755 [Solirubrobacteraceae bacterium]|jgi:hypothetical protein